MRDFAQLALETHPRFPMAAELWTWYHLETPPYPKCDADWGACLAYHFDRGAPLEPWLRLVGHVRRWVEGRPELQEIIEFVPFYEVGTDFFAQCKPPYDGGYPTTRYEEFLYHGDCEPAPWFYHQLAELHRRVAEAVRSIPSGPEGELLRKVVHATFIRPYKHLFWQDEDGWAVYQPNIAADDLREWASLLLL
jgi:hypothetical protein